MTVLLTGAAGYIGSHTCVELLNGGYAVVGVDNFSNAHPKTLERIKQITGKDVTFYEADVRDEAAVADILARHAVGCVIHFAGLKAVGESVAQPLRYYDHNLNACFALARAMEKTGVRRLVFSSSATVYNPANEMPLTEDSMTGGCTNPYGWTKYMQEQILTDIAGQLGWSVLLLRYFNPVGAHESGLIGEDPSGVPANLMPFIAQVAVGRREALTVHGNDYPTPDGTCIRDYLHVVDLAAGHARAVDYCAAHDGAMAVNLGTGRGVSVLEMVEAFKRVNGVNVPYTIGPRRPGDAPVCYAGCAKAEALLGWRARKTLEDYCRDTWRWQKRNPNGYRD